MSQHIFRSSTAVRILALGVAVICAAAPSLAQLTTDGNQFLTLASTGVPGAPAANDTFGRAFASGDFDGDGYDDLAVAAPGDLFAAPSPDVPGKVLVFYGSAAGFDPFRTQRVGQSECNGQANCLDLAGDAVNGEVFGFALAAGDFNGDSYDDLAVGVPWANSAAGEVSVALGSAAGLTDTNSQLWDQSNDDITGQAEPADLFGMALAADDFNGDGYDDLAIGIGGENVNFEGADVGDAGAVIALYGSMALGLSPINHQFWSQGNNLDGDASAGAVVGATLASGDFNGDGFADLAIAAPLADVAGLNAVGRIHEVHGSAGQGLDANNQAVWQRTIDAQAGMRLGLTLASGDFNNDGYDDIVFGGPFEDIMGISDVGRTDVLFGTPDGIVGFSWQQLSENLPPLAPVSNGIQEDDLLGYALATGDFDGDGFDDLAQAIPGHPFNGAAGSGAFRILPGTALRSPLAPLGGVTVRNMQFFGQGQGGMVEVAEAGDQLGVPWPNEPRPGASRFGNVATTGDFNGDGFEDLIMGVPLEDLIDPDTGLIPQAGGFHVVFGSRQPPSDLGKKVTDLNNFIQQLDAVVP